MDKVYKYTDDFKKLVFDFYKNNGLNSKEMSVMLKNMFMFFATDYTENKEYCSSLLNEKDTEDFKQMWSGFVQQFIDFVNSHPNVKETISREKERLDSMWNDDNCKYRIEPDLNIHFGADCLDESIKEGKWVCYTDSYMNMNVGNSHIVECF